MAWSLNTYLDRLGALLNDATQLSFTTDALTNAIRQALAEYSTQLPIETQTTLTLTSDSTEIDVSSISDLLNVTDVWLPYDATDPTAYHRRFRYWPDIKKVRLLNGDRPAAGDTARIFYTKPHAIAGLDGAATSTVPDAHAWILVRGAAALAVYSLALDSPPLTGGQGGPNRIRAWADNQYAMFHANLATLARSWHGTPLAQQPDLDRFEGDWA